MIDLHLHSRCSDGTLSPTELVERAHLRGVTALALTDHDTVAGNGEATAAGARLGVEVMAGVELSVQCASTSVHILGYGVECLNPEALRTYEFLERSRSERLVKMVHRLNALGVGITTDEVRRVAGGVVIGRLHVARVLVSRGFATSVSAAFSEYLSRGGKAYVERVRLSPAEAVSLLRGQGGVAVLAHPGVVEREAPDRLARVLEELIPAGLDGIEAHYSRHTASQTARFLELARTRSLLVTGGSDFHRPPPDGPEVGTFGGDHAPPDECLTKLKEAIATRRAG
jgi:predicted metal-dependent phosphoesterase TrpH